MDYIDWIKENEHNEYTLQAENFENNPLISVVIPVYNISEDILKATLSSVFVQNYSNWELCIADASEDEVTKKVLSGVVLPNKIKVKYIQNKNISDNTNEALSLTTGEYIVFLDHDDTLASFALKSIVREINNTKADFIYSDEDKILGTTRLNPHFKPDWSPDTLRSYNYICHLVCIKKTLLDEIGWLNSEYNGSQDYDLVLRATEKAKKITHIPKMLYHWRMTEGSTALKTENKMYAFVSAKKALRAHLKRIGTPGDVQDGMFLSSYKIYYNIKDNPLVSIIIPNNNQVNILKNCINSITKITKYPNYEIIIVENNSTDPELFKYYEQLKKKKNIKIIEWNNQPFNYSKINNFAVEHASGEYILFLNNDIQIINEDWLNRMMEYIIREDVGIVGAKLYYPDDTLQHGGVILGLGKEGMPGHIYHKVPRNYLGYMGRLKIVQNMTAVTGACLLTKKKVFNEVGGLEEFLILAFNDIDYCFKVFNKGYRVVWTPYAELYHYESLTRGYEDTQEKKERFWREFRYLRMHWEAFIDRKDKMFPIEGLMVRG
jgi:GT2 family glycosyltransferase